MMCQQSGPANHAEKSESPSGCGFCRILTPERTQQNLEIKRFDEHADVVVEGEAWVEQAADQHAANRNRCDQAQQELARRDNLQKLCLFQPGQSCDDVG